MQRQLHDVLLQHDVQSDWKDLEDAKTCDEGAKDSPNDDDGIQYSTIGRQKWVGRQHIHDENVVLLQKSVDENLMLLEADAFFQIKMILKRMIQLFFGNCDTCCL